MKPKYHNPKTPTILQFYGHLLWAFIEPCMTCRKIIKFFFFFLQPVLSTKYKHKSPTVYMLRVSIHQKTYYSSECFPSKLGLRKLFVDEKYK